MTYYLAIGAAILFGIATALQHRAARAVPVVGTGPIRLAVRLLHDRLWLAGRLTDIVAVVLQALALRHGSVVTVQSIAACGIIVAVSASAAMDKRPVSRHEIVGSTVVLLGVVMIGRVVRPIHHMAPPPIARWITAGLVLGAFVSIVSVAIWRHRPRSAVPPSVLYGAAAGTCFAIASVGLKGASITFAHHGINTRSSSLFVWFLAVGAVGSVLAQRGFQLGELRLALAALVAAEPVAALIGGAIVFNERLPTNNHGAIGLGGLLTLGVGLITVTRPDKPPNNANTRQQPGLSQ